MDIIEYHNEETGIFGINIGVLAKKWNHLWFIFDSSEKFRLIKYKRKDSQIRAFQATISESQAKQIIIKLGLLDQQNPVFRRYKSWRKPEHIK